MLRLSGIHVHYGKLHILRGVSLEIASGESVALLGRNGVGKTTTLRAIMGLARRSQGTVEFDGVDLSRVKAWEVPRLGIGYVPQGRGIFGYLSVMENILVGLEPVGGKDTGQLDEVFTLFPVLKEMANRQAGLLSGGQQQRTFLARALAQQADVYFMDEPFAGVDAATERAIQTLLQQLRRQGKTIFVVHHDLRTVPRYFDHVILMNVRLIASGPPAVVFNDDNLRKTYGGRLAILETIGQAVRDQERSA